MTWPGQWTAQGSMWPLQVHNKSPLTHCRSEGGTGELTMNSNHTYWFFPVLLWSSLGSFGFTFPDWKLTRAQSYAYCHDWAFLEVTSLKTSFITWGFAVRNLWLSDVVFLWPLNFVLLGNIPLVTLFVCPVPPDNRAASLLLALRVPELILGTPPFFFLCSIKGSTSWVSLNIPFLFVKWTLNPEPAVQNQVVLLVAQQWFINHGFGGLILGPTLISNLILSVNIVKVQSWCKRTVLFTLFQLSQAFN